MRSGLIALWLLLCSIPPAFAQLSVNIGIDLPAYPSLVRVPGYPVYYAPQVNSNYFFYDGLYWVYQDDNWYSSSWYNGPWDLVNPEVVPLFVLRVPVRYYRRPPVYFRGWSASAAPRWGDHWGNSWAQSRSGWDQWNRKSAPAPAPLPTYQRQYSGNKYPHAEQQQALQSQNYRRPSSPQQAAAPAPRQSTQPRGGGDTQRTAAPQAPAQQQTNPNAQIQRQQPRQAVPQRAQQAAKPQGDDKAAQQHAVPQRAQQAPRPQAEPKAAQQQAVPQRAQQAPRPQAESRQGEGRENKGGDNRGGDNKGGDNKGGEREGERR
jgi:hypothetical protein